MLCTLGKVCLKSADWSIARARFDHGVLGVRCRGFGRARCLIDLGNVSVALVLRDSLLGALVALFITLLLCVSEFLFLSFFLGSRGRGFLLSESLLFRFRRGLFFCLLVGITDITLWR